MGEGEDRHLLETEVRRFERFPREPITSRRCPRSQSNRMDRLVWKIWETKYPYSVSDSPK
jgi:hypothetical protein